MLDISLRPLKDRVFDPLCGGIPSFISPTNVTVIAFICGLASCAAACSMSPLWALVFWISNRALDCVDGALARHRGQASDLGGFIDLLCDFIVYSLIPISCAVAASQPDGVGANVDSQLFLWLPVALLEATFHVNNFVLFYISAVLEKRKAKGDEKSVKELTSVAMRPALVEGTEAGLLFTAMLAWPQHIVPLSWLMAGLVTVGITQRVFWVIPVLK